jgi:hypothetical protein
MCTLYFHVKCLLLSDFNQIWDVHSNFCKTVTFHENQIYSSQVVKYRWANRQTDRQMTCMAKSTGAFVQGFIDNTPKV